MCLPLPSKIPVEKWPKKFPTNYFSNFDDKLFSPLPPFKKKTENMKQIDTYIPFSFYFIFLKESHDIVVTTDLYDIYIQWTFPWIPTQELFSH
jgi:hypothetical protein